MKKKNCGLSNFFGKKILVVFAPRLELGTSRVWGERHNQLDHANCQPPTRIELVTFSLRRRCSANWAIEALFMELCLMHTKKFVTYDQKKWTAKRSRPTKIKKLHVRESNPGRLRDRQKCYQLHQRGQPPARIELATLRLLSACSARLSYRGTCMLPTRIELATLGLWDPRAANCATGAANNVCM